MNSEDDVLFKHIGNLLREKRITDIKDIFSYIPIETVAQKLEIDKTILLDFIENPNAYQLGFVYRLAEIFDYDTLEMSHMMASEYEKKINNKST